MLIDLQDEPAYETLIKQDCQFTKLPLFSQFFFFVRESYPLSVEETAAFLQVNPEIIINLENGQIWGNVNHINLASAEELFNLKEGSLKKILRQTLIVKSH